MDKRTMTCIICPRGCRMEVVSKGKELISCTGNYCKRGIDYAKAEITAPMRILTSTVGTISKTSPRLPVKTSAPIPKEKIFEGMEIIKKLRIEDDVQVGDILIHNFIENGVNLIGCKTIYI